MSHEIRTPMNAIIGMSELAQRDYGAPKALEYIAEIRHAGADLLAIINDILDFSKIGSGSFQISPSPYETSSLFNDVLTIIGLQAGEKSLSLTTEIDPNLPRRLIGDEVRIRQILLNLLSNAVKYTHEGGVIFRAGFEGRDDGVKLVFKVEDSGIGIKSEHIENIFGDFVRLGQKGDQHVEGTGLGLSISRGLCRLMGGDIAVKSEYGRGSAFTATVTQGVADWAPSEFFDAGLGKNAAWETGAPFSAPGFRVLIVDDIAVNLAVARGLLAPFQMKMTTCRSGREALDEARKKDFDLIFIDHMMPGMDGLETAKAIRETSARFSGVPIIALTANAMAGMREMFLSRGFDDYMSKPIETAKLNELLEKWVPIEARVMISPDSPGAPKELIPFEIEGLDAKSGLKRIGGRAKDYLEALAIYCREAESILPILEKLGEADMPAFITGVHALKSASANIGAAGLAEEAAFLEAVGHSGDLPAILKGLEGFRPRLIELVGRIRGALSSARALNGHIEEAEAGPGPAADDLRRLKAAISARNIQAIDLMLADLSAASFSAATNGALSAVADYVLTSDFEEAEGLVNELLGEAGS
jgi:CheY-like chemotaxis protein